MRSATNLWDLYEQWKRLTEKEGEAIRTANWLEVRRCQKAKQQLQSGIIKVTDGLKTECSNELQNDQLNSQIRRHVNELIQLETRNHSILGQCMAKLQNERGTLEETSNRLKKVRKSYVPSPQPIWNQYS